ncbi:MAG: hypothetical protein AAGI07_00300 [Bacteroidota bacterium]
MPKQFLQYFEKHGLAAGFMYLLGAVFAYQIWHHREKLTDVLLLVLKNFGKLIETIALLLHLWHTKKIENKISAIYTYLYSLVDLSPTSIEIMKYKYVTMKSYDKKGSKITTQAYKATMIHEATFGVKSLKSLHQNIFMGNQEIELLIIQTMTTDKLGLYVNDIEDLHDGDLKDEYQSHNIKSFYSIILMQQGEKIYTMIVKFINANKIDSAEIARLRIVAANIQKLISSNKWTK